MAMQKFHNHGKEAVLKDVSSSLFHNTWIWTSTHSNPIATNKVKKHHIDNQHTQSHFQFVNITQQFKDIDVASRATIRKHVKLNKNRLKPDRIEPTTSQRAEVEEINRQSWGLVNKFDLRQIQGVDPFDKTPIKLEPYMHDLLLYCM